MITENAGVRVQEAATCFLCGEAGGQLYSRLSDRLCNAPGLWNLRSCKICGLAWLDPQPLSDDIGKLYGSYYTHQRSEKWQPGSLRWKLRQAVQGVVQGSANDQRSRWWRLIGTLAARLPAIRDWAGLDLLWMKSGARGTLLDMGCGSGEFLQEMKGLGWQVLGIEPDPKAARVARETSGSTVFVGCLEDASLPDASIDVIMIHHVIEHLHDPLAALRECHRVLRVGGKVVVVTPNVMSLGHRQFREGWRGLEPPRHLFLFSRRSLRNCAQKARLEIQALRTSARGSRANWLASRAIKRAGAREWAPGWISNLRALTFFINEAMARVFWPDAGEELFMIATKPDRACRMTGGGCAIAPGRS